MSDYNTLRMHASIARLLPELESAASLARHDGLLNVAADLGAAYAHLKRAHERTEPTETTAQHAECTGGAT